MTQFPMNPDHSIQIMLSRQKVLVPLIVELATQSLHRRTLQPRQRTGGRLADALTTRRPIGIPGRPIAGTQARYLSVRIL